MENKRPYWKVIVSLFFSLSATILFLYVGLKAIVYFVPFVVAWIISSIANPLVCWLEKRLKIEKKWGSAITIILVLAAVIGLLYLAISKLVTEIGALISSVPELYRQMSEGFTEIGESLSGVISLLPKTVRDGFSTIIVNVEASLGEWIGALSKPTVNAAGRFAMSIPTILIGTIVAILAAYFFIADREEVLGWVKKVTPEPITRRMDMVFSNLKYAVGGYFKAQFKIMGVVFAILVIGFAIIGVEYGIILAMLIAFLDFFPFFGTGTAMIPWVVYKFLVKDYKMAIFLFVLYAITQIVRQLIQPKLVGDSVGLKPLPTLVFLYIGYKVGSILGLILAVPIGLIILNMYRAGAFDYILDDVKILVRGIISLRKEK